MKILCYAAGALLGVFIGLAWTNFWKTRVDMETEFMSFAIPASAGAISFVVGFALFMLAEIYLFS